MWNLKKIIQMNLFTKQKQIRSLKERTYGYQRGRVGGKVREFGIDMYTLLYLKQIINKDLLYSTGNSAQYSVTTQLGKEFKNESVQFSSVAQSCPTLYDPMDCSMAGFPVHYQLPELAQTHVHHVGEAIQPSHFCHPLLLLHSIFPSIRVFSSESVLRIRWPK